MPLLPQLTPDRRSDALALARGTGRRALAEVRRTPGLFVLSLVIGAALWVFVTDVENPTIIDTFPAPIPVETVNVGEDLAVANTLPSVEVRVVAPQDRWERLNAGHLRAYVDLRGRDARSQEVLVQVDVEGISGVRVVDTEPRTVLVNLEDLVSREVEVEPRIIGTLPIGYEIERVAAEMSTVHAVGPESWVAEVSSAVASVNVTGLTVGVEQTVPLQPQGAGGGVIGGVRLEPGAVRISVHIAQRTLVRTVPLSIEVIGEPDPGYRVSGVAIAPSAIQVQGPIDALQQMDGIRLPAINIAGARSDVVRSVPIPIGPGIDLTGRDRATVTITIVPITGSVHLRVPVDVDGLDDGLAGRASPANVDLRLEGPLPVLNVLTPSDVRAVVDAAGRGPGTFEGEVAIEVPEGVSVDALQPESVTVTIE